ncbi:hypothetical protein [Streptomyces spirodelae]|uniref:DUF3558 domain-containing protein n=1 Tax=Streptomyces spirodelae TaxID=2812904 RepID=A0ABS3WQV1_9ACTN|nr:hypothetical protein [Streptomyces spirodelae]MBO8185483.1 hypothetical protein [Streptomyces spirodelae]
MTTKCDALVIDTARTVRVVGTGFLTILLVSGCGETKREYRVPHDLCGMKVAPESIKPFLPGGKNLSENDWFRHTEEEGTCTLSVDGERQLQFSGSWTRRESVGGYHLRFPTRLQGGKYIVGEREAAAHFSCFNPKARFNLRTSPGKSGKSKSVPADTYVVRITAYHEPEGREESKKAMKDFIIPFTKELKKQLPCQEKPTKGSSATPK